MNPGTPTKEYFLENYDISKSDLKNYEICKKCKIIMDLDKGTGHCEDCDICITGYDHHCPWTSKCIGKNNKILFKIFTCSLFLHIVYMIFAVFSLLFNY